MTYYLGILQRRVWIIVSLLIIGSTLGLIRGMRQPRIYMATTRVLVERQGPNVMQFDRAGSDGGRWDGSYYETQTQLVLSRSVLEVALENTSTRSVVERDPDFSRTSLLKELRRSLLAMLGASPAPPDDLWERLRERIEARHVYETHFVDIAATSRKKKNAVLLADRVARAYEDYHRRTRRSWLQGTTRKRVMRGVAIAALALMSLLMVLESRALRGELRTRVATRAIESAMVSVKGAPSDYLPWLVLARTYFTLGMWDHAEIVLKQARHLVRHREQVRMFAAPTDE